MEKYPGIPVDFSERIVYNLYKFTFISGEKENISRITGKAYFNMPAQSGSAFSCLVGLLFCVPVLAFYPGKHYTLSVEIQGSLISRERSTYEVYFYVPWS